MSEEQNDSPAFRLRPRRAAPKSYYTVRLEYSANPAAFERERPRGGSTKRKVFTQKTGSNTTNTATSNHSSTKPTVVSKEERELEERRMLLHRETSESIKANTLISPFIQRLQLDELEPESVYEHNYITMRIKEVEQSNCRRLLYCLCESVDSSCRGLRVQVDLHDEYANASLVKPNKIISIAKFRTSRDEESQVVHRKIDGNGDDDGSEDDAEDMAAIEHQSEARVTNNNGSSKSSPAPRAPSSECATTCEAITTATVAKISIKNESSDSVGQGPTLKSSSLDEHGCDLEATAPTVSPRELSFNVIVKFDELVERSTSNSNRGTPPGGGGGTASSSGGASVNRRQLIPFVSITDMIEQPTEPFVEMSAPSPSTESTTQSNDHPPPPQHHQLTSSSDHENYESKKVKFTANVVV